MADALVRAGVFANVAGDSNFRVAATRFAFAEDVFFAAVCAAFRYALGTFFIHRLRCSGRGLSDTRIRAAGAPLAICICVYPAGGCHSSCFGVGSEWWCKRVLRRFHSIIVCLFRPWGVRSSISLLEGLDGVQRGLQSVWAHTLSPPCWVQKLAVNPAPERPKRIERLPCNYQY